MKIKNIAKRILNSHKDSTLNCGFMINPYIFGGGAVGGWKELARTTLGSANTSIDVTSLPNKRYYMVLCSTDNTGNNDVFTRFNSDTGSNYNSRTNYNGAGEWSGAASSFIYHYSYANDFGYPKFGIDYIANYSTKEKLTITHVMDSGGDGAGNAPRRGETVGKWANTSNAISSLTRRLSGTNTYYSGSEVVVLGWDPADTHTTNFWTELASTTLTGSADTIDSGTFTAKKYLWVQAYVKQTTSNIRIATRFNSDTGSTYCVRDSEVGGADSTATSQTYIKNSGSNSFSGFINMFIVNVSSKEKLAISHYVGQNTAGAGNAPTRHEVVGKWANTSNSITSIQLYNDQAGDYASGSILKVWGSD